VQVVQTCGRGLSVFGGGNVGAGGCVFSAFAVCTEELLLPPLLLPDSSLGGFIGPVGLSASCRFGIFSGVLYNLSNVFDDHSSNWQVDRCFRALELQYATGRAIVMGGWPD